MNKFNLPKFRTATWNVYFGTPTKILDPVLEDSRKWGTTLWLINEAGGRDITAWLRDNGLETVVHDQYRVAWDPKRWGHQDDEFIRLSEQHWYQKDGKTPIWAGAQAATLLDKLSGEDKLDIEAVSYHTPAHIQRDNPAPRRYLAFLDALEGLGEYADQSEAYGFLSGGDDNWDEDSGYQTDDLKLMLGRNVGGLRQIQGGDPTFGGREIDDYRIVRLKAGGHVRPTGVSDVRAGGGTERPQHQIHLREWEWYKTTDC